jgi:hypothetical protein
MIKSKKTCLLCKCEVLDSNPSPTKKKKKKRKRNNQKDREGKTACLGGIAEILKGDYKRRPETKY